MLLIISGLTKNYKREYPDRKPLNAIHIYIVYKKNTDCEKPFNETETAIKKIFMNRIFKLFMCLSLSVFILPKNLLATNYYISVALGDDSRTPLQAQNSATPWKTVNPIKANYTLLVPGDSVLFRRGETHIASGIRPTVSGTAMAPIVWGAYDTGINPVLTGAFTVTGFTPATNPAAPAGVYQATLPNTNTIRLVFNNEDRQPIGRQPNSGYWYVTGLGTDAKTMFKDAINLTQATDYWKGANVGIRFEDWEWWAASVTAFDASTKQITLGSASYNNLRNGWGYFFTNKLEIVDTTGEWYQDVTNKILYYYPPAGADIANLKLDVAFNANAFFLRNINYNQVVNLTLKRYSSDAIYVDNTLASYNDGLGFKNVATSFVYTRGLQLLNCSNTVIDGCTFSDSQYEGVNIEKSYGTEMTNSQVLRTGLVPGLQARAGSGINVRPQGYNNRIINCLVDSSGKHGIALQDSLTTVERTVIKRSSLNTTDIGGIYLISPTCARDTIRNCFVSETGYFFGGYPLAFVSTTAPKGRGLYVDDYAHDIWMEGNTSFNNSNYGIHLINGKNVTLRNNTTYGNSVAEINLQEANGRTPRVPIGYSKYDIQNNVFVTTNPNNVVMRQETLEYNGSDFGVFNNNIYHHPTDNEVISLFYPRHLTTPYTSPATGPNFLTLALLTVPEFTAYSGQDVNSKGTKFKFNQYTVTDTLTPNLIANGNFETGISGWNNESAADFTLSQVTELNGKALSYKPTGTVVNRKNFTYSTVMNGNFAAGDYARLKFTLKTTNPNTTLRPFFAQNISPFASSGFGKDVSAKTVATTSSLVFQMTALQPSSVLKFAASIDAGEYFLDDVSLQKVSVTVNDLNRQQLLSNPTASPKTFLLNDPGLEYYDIDSVKINTGSVTVPAWSSQVVFTRPVYTLPVRLLDYKVEKKEHEAVISWATASEQANDHFEIEYSHNVSDFSHLASVAGKETTALHQSYKYIHTTPVQGYNYYRLIQVDGDGRRKTYGVKWVYFGGENKPVIIVYPSPAKNQINIKYDRGMFTTAQLSDAQGKVLQTKKIGSGDVVLTFSVSNYASGTYFIRLKGANQTESKLFLKK